MGTSQTVFVELRSRYNTGWTPPPTEFPNETFTKPVPSVLWARFTIVEGVETQLDIGGPVKAFRTYKELIIQLFAPLGSGSIDVLSKADTLADVFRNWCGTTISCGAASVKNIGNDGFGFYQVNIIVPFHTDVLH